MPEDASDDEFSGVLRSEIAELPARLREQLSPLLREPVRQLREFEYGGPTECVCWLFAELGERDVWIAYSREGHGSYGRFWGLVYRDEAYFGMDTGWYETLEGLLTEWFRPDSSTHALIWREEDG